MYTIGLLIAAAIAIVAIDLANPKSQKVGSLDAILDQKSDRPQRKGFCVAAMVDGHTYLFYGEKTPVNLVATHHAAVMYAMSPWLNFRIEDVHVLDGALAELAESECKGKLGRCDD